MVCSTLLYILLIGRILEHHFIRNNYYEMGEFSIKYVFRIRSAISFMLQKSFNVIYINVYFILVSFDTLSVVLFYNH